MANETFYRANVVLAPVTLPGEEKPRIVGLSTPITTSAKSAGQFAETLFLSGAIIGYRVVYSFNKVDWYFHEAVRLIPEEVENLKLERFAPEELAPIPQ